MAPVLKRVVVFAVGFVLAGAVSASAQVHRGGVVFVPHTYVYRPFVYNPFWTPWYPLDYAYPFDGTSSDIKTEIQPKDAEVYVDGYYAGLADDFDGAFKRLHVVPGGHAITLYLPGYRTATENVYIRPGSTFTLKTTMDPLPAGETSAPVPAPTPPPAPAPAHSSIG